MSSLIANHFIAPLIKAFHVRCGVSEMPFNQNCVNMPQSAAFPHWPERRERQKRVGSKSLMCCGVDKT